jgi:TonB family protein
MIYSFYIAADGTIYGIKKEKSSGNQQMDLTAERAIRASSPLSTPPREFRGRPIQFVAQFIHPPNP